jgi:hypothetical protein
MADEVHQLARHKGLLASESRVTRYERVNLTLVLLIAQTVQAMLLSVAVFSFFLVFGSITMKQAIANAWIGDGGPVHALSWLPNLSVELLQVSIFLGAFAGLYFTVYAVTDEIYRQQFFSRVQRDLERAIAVRAAYVAWHLANGREDELDEPDLEHHDRRAGEGTTELPSAPPPAADDQPTVQLRPPSD